MQTPTNAVQGSMARPTADTAQVTFRIPTSWLAQADALAIVLSRHGMAASRTDVFREAIALGMEQIVKKAKEAIDDPRTRYRVQGWDGRAGTCLFWFGTDEQTAIAEAKRLSDEASTALAAIARNSPSLTPQEKDLARYTIFRVFKGNEEEPIFDVMPGATSKERIARRVESEERAEKRRSKK